jgi:hypothetical protein
MKMRLETEKIPQYFWSTPFTDLVNSAILVVDFLNVVNYPALHFKLPTKKCSNTIFWADIRAIPACAPPDRKKTPIAPDN